MVDEFCLKCPTST